MSFQTYAGKQAMKDIVFSFEDLARKVTWVKGQAPTNAEYEKRAKINGKLTMYRDWVKAPTTIGTVDYISDTGWHFTNSGLDVISWDKLVNLEYLCRVK